jgi:hypothetical protein
MSDVTVLLNAMPPGAPDAVAKPLPRAFDEPSPWAREAPVQTCRRQAGRPTSLASATSNRYEFYRHAP